MKKYKLKLTVSRIIFIILSLACMVLIFIFSMEDSGKSSDRSGRVTETVVEIVVDDFKNQSYSKQLSILDRAEHIIRKLAHFSVYTALGFCISFFIGKRKVLSKKTAAGIVFCFIYSCSDEIHQYFVPGRACQFTDVLIDTSGALAGTAVSLIIMYCAAYISERKKYKSR